MFCRVQSALNNDRGQRLKLDTPPYGALYDHKHMEMHSCCALLKLP